MALSAPDSLPTIEYKIEKLRKPRQSQEIIQKYQEKKSTPVNLKRQDCDIADGPNINPNQNGRKLHDSKGKIPDQHVMNRRVRNNRDRHSGEIDPITPKNQVNRREESNSRTFIQDLADRVAVRLNQAIFTKGTEQIRPAIVKELRRTIKERRIGVSASLVDDDIDVQKLPLAGIKNVIRQVLKGNDKALTITKNKARRQKEDRQEHFSPFNQDSNLDSNTNPDPYDMPKTEEQAFAELEDKYANIGKNAPIPTIEEILVEKYGDDGIMSLEEMKEDQEKFDNDFEAEMKETSQEYLEQTKGLPELGKYEIQEDDDEDEEYEDEEYEDESPTLKGNGNSGKSNNGDIAELEKKLKITPNEKKVPNYYEQLDERYRGY